MSIEEWTARYPQAAVELALILEQPGMLPVDQRKTSEAAAQQQARMAIAEQGAMSWRNNVGSTPAKTEHICPRCAWKWEEVRQPVRYGLANDSHQLNQRFKSSDLILCIPRVITQDMIGQTIGQFGSVECKRPGWKFTGKGQEPAQLAWLELVRKLGGFAAFSTGGVQL